MTSPLPWFNHHVLAKSNFEVNSTQPEGLFACCKLCERAIANRLRDQIIRSYQGDLFCSRDCFCTFQVESPEDRKKRIARIGQPLSRPRRRREKPYHFFIDNAADAQKLRKVWEKDAKWKRLALKKSERDHEVSSERANLKAARTEAVPYFPFAFDD